MAAAQSWRLLSFDLRGAGDFVLDDAALYANGARVDAAATRTFGIPPTLGGMAWLQADAALPGFFIRWDFAADTTVDRAELTLGASSCGLASYTLQRLTAAGWVAVYAWEGAFPAAAPRVQPAYQNADPYVSGLILQLPHSAPFGVGLDVGPRLSVGAATRYVYADCPWGNKFGLAFSTDYTMSSHGGCSYDTGSVTLDGDFTLDCWLHGINSVGAAANVLALGSTPSTSWRLVYNHNGSSFSLTVLRPDGTTALTATVNSVAYAWRYVTWTRNAGKMRLYVSGGMLAEVTDTTSIAFSSAYLGHIGTSGETYYFLDGLRLTQGVERPSAVPTAKFPEPPRAAAATLRPYAVATSSVSLGQPPAFTVYPPTSGLMLDPDVGTGTVSGTVKKLNTPDNIPLQRRVRLHDKLGMRLIRETWSDPVTGAFSFTNVQAGGRYVVIAYDHPHQYRAVIDDSVEVTT